MRACNVVLEAPDNTVPIFLKKNTSTYIFLKKYIQEISLDAQGKKTFKKLIIKFTNQTNIERIIRSVELLMLVTSTSSSLDVCSADCLNQMSP